MDVLLHTAKEYRRRIALAMNYISGHLTEDLSLDDIAKAAAFSPFHFHRIFKAVTGETVGEFTRRLRLEMAANKLIAPRHQPVTEIAQDCGFSTSQNLAKAFRAHFGMSPTEYRNRKTGNAARNPEDVFLAALAHHFPHQNQTGSNTMKAEITELPGYEVAFVRKLGPYGKETAQSAFGELMRWAGPKGLIGRETMLGVYWDNPEVTPPEKCRTDACITVPPGTPADRAVGLQTIAGGPYAVCHFELTGDSFKAAWDEAYSWLVTGGYECTDQPCLEVYRATPETNNGKWLVDICIPLKRK